MVKRNYSKKKRGTVGRKGKGKGRQCGGTFGGSLKRRGGIRGRQNFRLGNKPGYNIGETTLESNELGELYSIPKKKNPKSNQHEQPLPPINPQRNLRRNARRRSQKSSRSARGSSNRSQHGPPPLPPRITRKSTNMTGQVNSGELPYAVPEFGNLYETKLKSILEEVKNHYKRDDFIIITEKNPKISDDDKNYYFYISKSNEPASKAQICKNSGEYKCVGTVYYITSKNQPIKTKLLYNESEGLFIQTNGNNSIPLNKLNPLK